jgi:uncharacterized membrane protein HdeD (DUF308 family)
MIRAIMHDAGRKIGRDLPCVRCGYNLRGLTSADHCPECNALVNASEMRQGFLRFVTHAAPLAESDPRWVRSIVGGMGYLSAAIGIQFVTPLVMELKFDPMTGVTVRTMLAAAGWIALVAGVFKVTTLEPPAPDRDVWTLRAAAVVCAVMAAALLFPTGPAVKLFTLIYCGATFVTTMLLHVHLGSIARRLPSKPLHVVASVGGFVLAFPGCVTAVAAPGVLAGPPTFGPIAVVARFALPGGLDATLARPGESVLKLCLVAIGCTPIWFLALWYARPHIRRGGEGA